MSWKDLKIAQKLYIGFGVVLMLTLLTGYAGYNGLSTYGAGVKNAEDANQLVKWVKDAAVARRDFALTGDKQYDDKVDATVGQMSKRIDESMTRLKDQDDRTAMEAIKGIQANYISTFNKWAAVRYDEAKQIEVMGSAATKVENLTGASGSGGVNQEMYDFQACRLIGKDYIRTKDDALISKFGQRIDRLLGKWNGSNNSFYGAVGEYKESFNKYCTLIQDDKNVGADLGKQANDLVSGLESMREKQISKMESAKTAAITLAVSFMFGAMLIGIFVAFAISRAIANPIKAIAKVADDVSVGDIRHEIHFNSKDEVGVLAESFRRLIDYMKSLAGAAERIAANDLTVQVTPKGDKDVLGNAFKTMTTNLTAMIRQVTDNSTQLVSAATEIASSSEQMARGSQEQTGQTAQVSSAVEEMTATIVESSRNAGEAANQAKEAANAARAGNQVVSQTIEGMNRIAQVVQESANTVQELAKSSDKIGEIIGVIDDIADQTNLLALNAAIEAARAGEQGRGFAVVADEVRKLAERTGKATKEITDMIKGIQSDTKGAVAGMEQGINEVQQGRELADKAGESLTAIATYSQKVMDMIQQIATAAEEQSAASEEIARSVEGIAKVTKENATGVEQSAAAAEQLNRQAEGLQKMVSRFKVNA
jgi:methyl-accepting chemotaxis protein